MATTAGYISTGESLRKMNKIFVHKILFNQDCVNNHVGDTCSDEPLDFKS